MSNMEYLPNVGQEQNLKFIEHMGAAARNRINEEYGKAVDEMFERLHRQREGVYRTGQAQEEHLKEIGGGYVRYGFTSKADRDRAVTDLQKQGVDAIYAPKKIGGQWLIEIPKSVKRDKLNAGSELAQALDEGGYDKVSADAIMQSMSDRIHVTAALPTPVSVEEETHVEDLQTNLHRPFTREMDTLGTVIERGIRFGNVLSQYGYGSDSKVFHTGKVDAGKVKKAVVINDEVVLIGGKVVTDKKTKKEILKRHEKREKKAERHGKVADFIIDKNDKINAIRGVGAKDDKRNAELHKRHRSAQFDYMEQLKILREKGKVRIEMDAYNDAAQAELQMLLAAGGFSPTPSSHTEHRGNGELKTQTYTNGGQTITVVHRHRETKEWKAPLTAIQENSQAIRAAAYKQEYALTRKYKTAEAFKDITITAESAVVLSLIRHDTELSKHLTDEQKIHLQALSRSQGSSEMSYKTRAKLTEELKSIRSEMKGSSVYTEDDVKNLDAAINEIQLSEYERNEYKKQNRAGEIAGSLLRIDFGVGELEAIADDLNTEWHLMRSQKNEDFTNLFVSPLSSSTGATSVSLMSDIRQHSTGIALSVEEATAVRLAESGAVMTVESTYHLNKALDKYEDFREKAGTLTQADTQMIQAARKKAELNADELKSAKHITAIRKELGVTVNSGNFSPDKLLEMNKALFAKAEAAGMNIFKRTGINSYAVDTKLLNALTAEQLARLGISSEMRDLMVKVNEAQRNGSFSSGLGDKVISLLYKMDDSGSIAEMMNAARKIKRGYQYTRSGYTYIRHAKEARKKKRDEKRADKSGYGSKYGKDIKKRSDKKKSKDKNEKKLWGSDSAAIAKKGAKVSASDKKAVDKAVKREHSIRGQYAQARGKLAQWASQTAIGKAVQKTREVIGKVVVKPILIGGGVLFLIEAVLIIIIIVLQSISSFLDAVNPVNIIHNALAPDTYAETVAYKLYDEVLRPREEDWIKEDLQDYENIYDERTDLRYGADYQDFAAYMATVDGVVIRDGDEVYINPFHSSGVSNPDMLTPANHTGVGYDGKRTLTFGANNNAFSKIREDSTLEYGYSTVESGHTSNIKDILCMTDVMYGMDLSDATSSSDRMENILGKSPAQMTWDNAVENVKGFFSWLWNTIKAPFTDAKYEPLKNFCNSNVSYSTVVRYCDTLFENSHQQEIALKVEYYKTDPVIVQTESGAVDITDRISQVDASALGYCVDPVTKKFYLKWNNNIDGHGQRVSPYFTQNADGTGTQYVVDTDLYDVRIDMSNYADADPACLKNDMTNNEPTYQFISGLARHEGALGIDDPICWQVAEDRITVNTQTASKSSTGGDGYYTGTAGHLTWHNGSGGWWDDIDDAKASAIAELNRAYTDYHLSDPIYFLSGDRNNFSKTWFEQPAFDFTNGTVQETQRISGDHQEEYTECMYFCSTEDHAHIVWSETGDGCGEVIFDVWVEGTLINSGYPCTEEAVDAAAAAYAAAHGLGEYDYTWGARSRTKTRWVLDYKTQYRVENSTCVLANTIRDSFERHCEGHDFKYCGGHIGVHSHGTVFSMTNEQIALADVWDEKNGNPLADGFVLEDHGYEELRGKVIPDDVHYPKDNEHYTAHTASVTGGCRSPLFDPQGSASGMYGLNVKAPVGDWEDGYDVRGSDAFHLMRDIFDIDCIALKGDNVFPIEHCDINLYEGWSADNMSLAILKFCADWYEEYGFDIPQEISCGKLGDETGDDENPIAPYEYGYEGAGQAPLSQKDIDAIIDALKANPDYATVMTDTDTDREQAVRMALGFVGKGHYNPLHNHDFLAQPCNGLHIWTRDADGHEGFVDYDGCCTAGDEEDFTNFIRRHFGKSAGNGDSPSSIYNTPYSYQQAFGRSNAYPADVIAHKAASNLLDYEIPFALTNTWMTRYAVMQLEEFTKFRTVFFVGIVREDIQLSTGQILKAGVPITIDLTKCNASGVEGLGNIYLHGRIGTDDFEGRSFNDYSWLIDRTSRTRIARFN